MAQFPESPDGLHPAKRLRDEFAFALTDGVPGMPRGAAIHGTAAMVGRGVLGHVRRDVHHAQRDGGGHPLWLPDGKALYFDRQQRLFRLAVDTASPSASGPPVALPVQGFEQGEFRRQFDLMPDGARFLVLFAR